MGASAAKKLSASAPPPNPNPLSPLLPPSRVAGKRRILL